MCLLSIEQSPGEREGETNLFKKNMSPDEKGVGFYSFQLSRTQRKAVGSRASYMHCSSLSLPPPRETTAREHQSPEVGLPVLQK